MRRKYAKLILGALLGMAMGTPYAAESDVPGADPDKALLEVSEPAPFRLQPAEDAKEIGQLEPGTKLVLLTHKKHGPYWRVIRIGRGPNGWVDSGKVKFLRDKADVEESDEGAKCADALDRCPERGCAKEGEPEAIANAMKRRAPEGGDAVILTFDDYAHLQEQADERVGQGLPELDQEGHAKLGALTTASGTVAEGALVRTYGYIAKGGPGLHINAHGESVNCNLKGKSDNDFHIPLVGHAGDGESAGIVVEMIPQQRADNWRMEALEKARDEGREAWVEGALYYDKEHYVSADADNPLKDDPNRGALWEIHPITKFLVCRKDKCARDREEDWEAL